ncbi:MAG: SLC13 family permease, partial [Hyphomicrobium sp.]|nr:SLC13 family permease [Hyphomicrobium sp.]
GEGLVRTGVAQKLGDLLVRHAGRSEAGMITLLMVMVATIGAFMSSTGVVAIFIPIVLRVAANASIPAGRLMMPLSMAALISGMMSLIATAPNLVVQSQLMAMGHEGFSFFAYTPFGLPILILAVLYMLAARHWLAPDAPRPAVAVRPSFAQFIEHYHLAGREHRLRLTPSSPWVGKCLGELDLRAAAGINILAVDRATHFNRVLIRPQAETRLRTGDVRFRDVFNPETDIIDFARTFGLEKLG